MKIATLGPIGTFSHEAAIKYSGNTSILLQTTIWNVFNCVKQGKAEKGIAPLENSVSGTVGLTLDALMDFNLKICAEIIIPVRHNLAANDGKIKKIYSNLQAFAQCEKFIRAHLGDVEVIPTESNAKSAEKLAMSKGKGYGAIVPMMAIKKYNLKCVARDIQDSRFNVTRFVVLDKKSHARTGKDRTSIAIYPHKDKAGFLYGLIGEFANRGINLTKIESRPSKGKLGDYIFFIDLQGHESDLDVKNAFKSISKSFFLKVLGSYPRAY